MTAEVISYMAANGNITERMEFEIVSQCAPFLKGMKAAGILNIDRECAGGFFRLMADSGISCKKLADREKRRLVLFYRKAELERVLLQKDVEELLREYGYEGGVEEVLAHLLERMERYAGREISFPHEIGAILGYPVRDVRAFISRNGQGSLFTGYWKVYHDPARAAFTFFAYDKARDSAVNEFLSGKTMREIAGAGTDAGTNMGIGTGTNTDIGIGTGTDI